MPSSLLPTRRALALTQTELMIAMVIGALLLALLFPAVQSARGSAHAGQCQLNLRQLLAAWHQYAVDHSGRIVPPEEELPLPGTPTVTAAQFWPVLLEAYFPGEIIRRYDSLPSFNWLVGGRPDGTRLYGRQSPFDCPANDKWIYFTSNPDYGYNYHAFSRRQTSPGLPFYRMNSIPYPARQLVFMDVHFGEGAPFQGLYSYQVLSDNPDNWAGPHRGKLTQIGFADGHVEAWPLEKLKAETTGDRRYFHAPWFAR